MSWVRSPAGKAILGILGIYAAMIAAILGFRAAGVSLGGDVRLGIAIAAAAPAGWFILTYWRAIDEAAREAQKWAWFWGGSIGLGLGLIAIMWQPDRVIEALGAGGDPVDILQAGAVVLMAAQLAGFLLAWIFWWGSRR